MTHHVDLSARARRDLDVRLPTRIALAASAFIYGPLAENPMRVGKSLGGRLTGHRAARVGQYRVLYRVDDERVVVLVVTVAHRGVVYRR